LKRRIPQLSFLLTMAMLVLVIKFDPGVSAEVSKSSNPGAGPTAQETINPRSYYRLTTQWTGTSKSLDIVNDGKKNNQLILANTDNVSGQMWKFTPLAGGYYRLTTEWQPGKSLDVVNDGKNNKLALAKTAMVSGQYWKISPLGEGYYRLTTQWQGDGKSLDIVNDGKNNNQLILASTDNVTGQMWKITKVK